MNMPCDDPMVQTLSDHLSDWMTRATHAERLLDRQRNAVEAFLQTTGASLPYEDRKKLASVFRIDLPKDNVLQVPDEQSKIHS